MEPVTSALRPANRVSFGLMSPHTSPLEMDLQVQNLTAKGRATRERIQNESLTRLTALGVPLRQLELLMDGAATSDAVLRLSRNFDA